MTSPVFTRDAVSTDNALSLATSQARLDALRGGSKKESKRNQKKSIYQKRTVYIRRNPKKRGNTRKKYYQNKRPKNRLRYF